MLTLVGQSLLGQATGIQITYPTSEVPISEGMETSIRAAITWAPNPTQDAAIGIDMVYEGIVTPIVANPFPALNLNAGQGTVDFPVTIPTLTGLSNRITYLITCITDGGVPVISSQITLTVGTSTPEAGQLSGITIDFPEENANVSVTEPVWIQATVLPLSMSRNTSVDFFANGYKINDNPVRSSNGYFDFSWDEHWVGNIRITARATLNNGTFVETAVPRRFNVRPVGSAPEIKIEAVDGTNDVIGGYNKAFTVHVNDSGSLVEEVILWVNGVAVGTASADAYPFRFDFKMPQYGIIEVWATAKFSNGNRARTETLRYVLNTGSAPVVELLSPLDGATFLAGSDVSIFATAYDSDSLIDSIDFFVNDTYITTVKRERMDLPDQDGKFFTPLTKRNVFDFNYEFPFAGDYRIFAQAVDETGRMTRSNVAHVTVGAPDKSYPVVSISNPAGGIAVGAGSTMWLNANASDEDGFIRSVKFFANGQEIGETATGWGNDFAYAFRARSTGTFYVYAQAKDNHGKITQSAPVIIEVMPIISQMPTVYLREIDPIYQDLPAALDPVRFVAEANVYGASQANPPVAGFYANGVLLGKLEIASSVFEAMMVPTFVGDVSITVVVEDTGNLVMSNARTLRVAPPSQNVAFFEYVMNNFLCGYFFEEFLDMNIGWGDGYYEEIIRALDNGQRTRAEFIHEIMMVDDYARDASSPDRPALNYARIKNALMIRWALTGAWPTSAQLASDAEIIRQLGMEDEGSGERRLVRLLLPSFQMNFFDGKRLPDSFSSKGEFEDFIKVLFKRKFGTNPTKAQVDRCVTILEMGGMEWFVRDFILDEEAMRFGSGTVSTLLGMPNPPNHMLADYANSASLFIGLLKIVPLQSDVESRANLPLLQQIQIILDAMPEI